MTFSIDQFVADRVAAIEDAPGHAGPAIDAVLARVVAEPAAIESVLGHPRDQPVFTTWFNSDELTVLHVVWPPTADLVAHDHTMWATTGLYGGDSFRDGRRMWADPECVGTPFDVGVATSSLDQAAARAVSAHSRADALWGD